MSKINAIILTALVTLLPLLIAVPVSATITGRPTIYVDAVTGDPLYVQAGTYVNISLGGMTISGAQVWLWLSPHGGAEISTALGDRWYAGPFYMGHVTNTTHTFSYTWAPADLPLPFRNESATYRFIVGNNWINGTIPFMVEGGDKDYWIKVVDVTPAAYIPSSEVGVSTNRIRFTPNYFMTPTSGAPNTTVTVSGYAVPTTIVYNITQGEPPTLVAGLVRPARLTIDGWNWTGFSVPFPILDLR
ncbi:MAG: hypothetical protein NZ952_05415, partial [Candidatus Bathyarchaeota archaeon]|nr:hypothetical protein [Candidatus Bathyarchaeota archaeon]